MYFNKIFVQPYFVNNSRKSFVYMFLDTVLRQKMHNRWAAARQNKRNDLRAQRRLVSAQSDQSLRYPYGETLGPLLPIERTAKTLIGLSRCTGWSESLLSEHDIYLALSCGGSHCTTTTTTITFASHWAHSEDSDQTWWMHRLISVLAERKSRFVGFLVQRLRMHYYFHYYYYTTEQCLYN